MLTSSMLMPASPAARNSLASSPGRSGMTTCTVAKSRAGPPCLPGIRPTPSPPRPSRSATCLTASSSPAARLASASATPSRSAAHCSQHRAGGFGVRAQDLQPHGRTRGRDPGDVAQTLARQRQRVARARPPVAPPSPPPRRVVRGHQRHPLVMLSRRHRDRLGAAGLGQPRYQPDAPLRRSRAAGRRPTAGRRTGPPWPPPGPTARDQTAGGRARSCPGRSRARGQRASGSSFTLATSV